MRRIFTIRLGLNVVLPSKRLPEFNFFKETPQYSDKSCYFGPRFPIGLPALCIQGKCHVSPTAPRPVSPRSFTTGKSRASVRCLWFDARNGPRRRIRACQRVGGRPMAQQRLAPTHSRRHLEQPPTNEPRSRRSLRSPP